MSSAAVAAAPRALALEFSLDLLLKRRSHSAEAWSAFLCVIDDENGLDALPTMLDVNAVFAPTKKAFMNFFESYHVKRPRLCAAVLNVHLQLFEVPTLQAWTMFCSTHGPQVSNAIFSEKEMEAYLVQLYAAEDSERARNLSLQDAIVNLLQCLNVSHLKMKLCTLVRSFQATHGLSCTRAYKLVTGTFNFNLGHYFPGLELEYLAEAFGGKPSSAMGEATRKTQAKLRVAAGLLAKGHHLTVQRLNLTEYQHMELVSRFNLHFDVTLAQQQRIERQTTFLQLSNVHVHFINSSQALKQCAMLFDVNQPVGMDVEWFPAGVHRAETVQLAQRDHCFILDFGPKVQALGHTRLHWNTVLGSFLSQVPEVIVFGDADFQAIRNRHRDLSFWSNIKLVTTLKHRNGLNALVLEHFGKPLDKEMQQSDWSQRPLTPDQLHYASLDAWVLLQLARGEKM